jgi:CHASE2 domain-containing sensor protein/signal transduction histidine kinase
LNTAAGLRRRDEWALLALLGALAAALALGGWAWRLDRLVYDLGLSLWTRPAPPGITVIAIDDASVQAIGRWPWPRAVHATLLEKLAAAKPRAVALDLVLSEPDPAQDRWLAQALQHAAPVVLPLAWQAGGSGPLVALQPAEPLRAAALLGAAEAPVDADGVLRHAFLHAGPADAMAPHLALALLQAGGEAPHPALRAETVAEQGGNWRRDGRFLIRYAGPPGSVTRVSYADVLRGAVPAEQLAGRYLLVGMTAQGLGDTLATPVNARHQAMPGIEVLAHTLYTLRSGDVLRPLPDAAVALVSALLLGLLLWGFHRLGPRAALPLALVSVPLVLLASLLALRSGWWASPVPYAGAALLAYPLWSWRRLERTLAGLDQEIARLAAEPLLAQAPHADAIEARLATLQQAGTLVREAHAFLADTLAAMPTAMLVADERLRVLLANPPAAALFEIEDAAEMQGLDLPRLLAEFTLAEALDWPAALAALPLGGDGLALEAQMHGQGDHVLHAAAVPLQGQRRLVLSIADVAPVKQAQQQREEALAFVSHDLRSPASSIVLLADMKLQGAVATPHDELLQEVRRLAARTLALSEAFVRAAHVQTQALQTAPVALPLLLQEALAELQPQATAAGVRLVNDIASDTAVVADRALLLRALSNLLSNAVKHSPAGAAVELRARCTAGQVQLQVLDQGPGFSPAQLQQLAQGQAGAAVQQARGVGLGLLFVQRVAQRHGGRLRAENRAGGGACLSLELPQEPPRSGNP